ncbi:prepilin peptidase [Tropicibacter sp. R16_0]|uniref:prepilin peptidase n=1 Tax=Tropicibacter sp. R16_0 TaxID=2821102 RepID=UPI001AD9EAB9|nr:prepilin peptidase [Tropicibacter sp. R16_0]MBO9451568.1 prepilin peptidase [Tropicibacter sp. R16_0]
MALTAYAAWWFLPFVLPICCYVALTDLREMRITNKAVMALFFVFVIVGPFALPLTDPWQVGFIGPFAVELPLYVWQFLQLIVVLLLGMVLNMIGAVGAGDAKFAAAAAPFIAAGDIRVLVALFAANLLAAWTTHKIAKFTALRRLAPNWQSWTMGLEFPMGLSLGGTLGLYLILGTVFGS